LFSEKHFSENIFLKIIFLKMKNQSKLLSNLVAGFFLSIHDSRQILVYSFVPLTGSGLQPAWKNYED